MSWRSERARLAVTIRDRPDDHQAIAKARRDLRAARLEEHVRQVVVDDPPLTAKQVSRIAAALRNRGGEPR